MKKSDLEEIKKITLDIFNHPELGYEEWKTKGLVLDYMKKILPRHQLPGICPDRPEIFPSGKSGQGSENVLCG